MALMRPMMDDTNAGVPAVVLEPHKVQWLSFLDTKYVEELIPVLDVWVGQDGWPVKANVVEEKKLIVSYQGCTIQVFIAGRHPPVILIVFYQQCWALICPGRGYRNPQHEIKCLLNLIFPNE